MMLAKRHNSSGTPADISIVGTTGYGQINDFALCTRGRLAQPGPNPASLVHSNVRFISNIVPPQAYKYRPVPQSSVIW